MRPEPLSAHIYIKPTDSERTAITDVTADDEQCGYICLYYYWNSNVRWFYLRAHGDPVLPPLHSIGVKRVVENGQQRGERVGGDVVWVGGFTTPASQLLKRGDACCWEMENRTVKKEQQQIIRAQRQTGDLSGVNRTPSASDSKDRPHMALNEMKRLR
ncbi:hypothetical protein Q5P01_008586 [Channa striata]|uniref:Uncharacterized protein n=1 Tax=Channa striata TaxID=64152 RepID=A0AA88MZV0_CHASR|nr:hypothetical protein Q5P01_008586 [Channa striata]